MILTEEYTLVSIFWNDLKKSGYYGQAVIKKKNKQTK